MPPKTFVCDDGSTADENATCKYTAESNTLHNNDLDSMTNDQLISAAENALRPRMVKGRMFGDVGASIVSASGRLFVGVSVDTPSWGLCAERCALATMISAGEYAFKKAVAVWRDPTTQLLHILPPCGICREFMRSIDDANLDSEIVLGQRRVVRLGELLPAHEWPEPM